MLTAFLLSLGGLLPLANPALALVAYASLTASMPPEERRRQATWIGVYVFLILSAFAIVGTLLLSALGIDLSALQIAGGLVVGYAGFGMLNPSDHLSDTEQSAAQAKALARQDISFSPMALPLIAGPGAIGAVIALAARHTGVIDRLGILAAIAVIAVVIVLLLRYGTPLAEKLGPNGVGALTRIMGFLILAIGVELVTRGFLDLSS